jgi:type IV pilus assembly protein PilB
MSPSDSVSEPSSEDTLGKNTQTPSEDSSLEEDSSKTTPTAVGKSPSGDGASTSEPTTDPGKSDLRKDNPNEDNHAKDNSHQDNSHSPQSDNSTSQLTVGRDKKTPATVSDLDLETDEVKLDRVTRQLLLREIVDPTEVETAVSNLIDGEDSSHTLWRSVASLDSVDRDSVYGQAAQTYAFDFLERDLTEIDFEFVDQTLSSFPDAFEEKLVENLIIPCYRASTPRASAREEMLVFASPDPMSTEVRDTVQALDVSPFDLRYISRESAQRILSEARSASNEYLEQVDSSDLDLGQTFEEEDEELIDSERLEEEISQSGIINLFEAALVDAVRDGASDLHIYPNSDGEVEILFRVNGRLQHWHTEDRMQPEAVLSVIKDNSMNVDRFENDAAQDGFIEREIDGTLIRFRVSIMPLASGGGDLDAESIVIRVLDDRKVITDISKLGLGDRAMARFQDAINQPYGMVILTGPTGSGKSTTLVAALHQVMGTEDNVITIEDPVEYVIDGARQIKLSDKLQLEDALRSVLRHDPDTVMVGEMRDQATAELAIKLANTGHLTFSTLHTNDAPSAVTRLYKMDIEPFLIAYAINLVVAQRLIRTLCPNCRQPITNPDQTKFLHLGFTEEEIEHGDFYAAGTGCKVCGGTGYEGRRAIAEALYFTDEIRHLIVEAEGSIDESSIREHAEQKDGMLPLQASARRSVLSGETSVEEMQRVVAT